MRGTPQPLIRCTPTTLVGPVTNKPQLEKILHYIDVAEGESARVVLGGSLASGPENS